MSHSLVEPPRCGVITTRDENGTWGTIGVSENIIEASWNALVESLEYGLIRCLSRTEGE